MLCLDITLPSPEENLALEECLLDWVEEHPLQEYVRFWESSSYFVVLGQSNKIQEEVYLEACQKETIPILRRTSGGGAVLQGPGCLNYALFLPLARYPQLTTISSTNTTILTLHKEALSPFLPHIEIQGISDLAFHGKKFSGNAQKRKKNGILYHGTFLTHFDNEKMETLLRFPSKYPAYRQDRSHKKFVTNIPMSPSDIKSVLKTIWNTLYEINRLSDIDSLLSSRVTQLVQEKYSRKEWNFKY